MSRENIEVVRSLQAPWEGKDVIDAFRQVLEQIGPAPQSEAVLAAWAEDPGWRHLHPEIEWDTTAVGAVGSVARGPTEVASWWADWVEVWERYVYRTVEYRDLGDWVLTPVDVRASTRDGMNVEMRTFQIWQVRDDKVAVQRAFVTEQEALEAVGLRE